jgi:phosphomethylpyrimidine synthase
MSAKDNFSAKRAKVDQAAVAPFSNSKKIHFLGTRADLQVSIPAVTQSEYTSSGFGFGFGFEVNPPVMVYDCLGP